VAILSANYMAARLDPYYKILFRGTQGQCVLRMSSLDWE